MNTPNQDTAAKSGIDTPTVSNCLPSLYDVPIGALQDVVAQAGEPAFRAKQLAKWLYQKGPVPFSEMTDLSKRFRAWLEENYSVPMLTETTRLESKDGSVKFLFGLDDGHHIESVVMPSGKTWTICMSTQVGCKMGCTFCVTGKMGFRRNLTAGEIALQFLQTQKEWLGKDQPIQNIVLMGMGEPLDNWEQLKIALANLIDEGGANVTERRITLSTVGLADEIPIFLDTFPRMQLAVSLVAPTQEQRQALMPVAKKHSLDKLLAVCRKLPIPVRRRMTFEYAVLAGVNDRPEDLNSLTKALHGIRCKINLIPFNPDDQIGFDRPTIDAVEEFRDSLTKRGVTATIRWSKALDIQGACGQLADRYATKG